MARAPLALDLAAWRERFIVEQWRVVLSSDCVGEAELRLRANTYTGRPAGDESFVARAEATLKRRVKAGKGGRPKKIAPDLVGQDALFAEGGA